MGLTKLDWLVTELKNPPVSTFLALDHKHVPPQLASYIGAEASTCVLRLARQVLTDFFPAVFLDIRAELPPSWGAEGLQTTIPSL